MAPDRGADSPERAADLLAATIGAGEAEVIDRAALFAAWRTAIEVAARRSPLVVVFEDLHWSSDSLLDLVEFIVQPRGDAAVLMIALTVRAARSTPGVGRGRRNYVAMSLEPLSDDSVAQLVRHMVGRGPRRSSSVSWRAPKATPSSRARLSRPSGSASARCATACRRARARDASRRSRRPSWRGSISLSPGAASVAAGRRVRRCVQRGRDRSPGPDLASDSDSLVDRLVRKDLIRPSTGDTLAFRHMLIEVAYQTLLRTERALHAAVAPARGTCGRA